MNFLHISSRVASPDLIRAASRISLSGVLENVIPRFPDVSESIVRDLSSKDPSRKNKYLSWMVREFSLGGSVPDITGSVSFFDKNSSRFKERDINKYSLKDLENEVKSLGQSSRSVQKDLKTSGSKKILETPDYLLIRVDSKEAVVQYGKGTKWCITMKDASYFEEYSEKNVVFYYMISRKPEETDPSLQKIAIAVLRNEENKVTGVDLYDAEDNLLDDESLVELKFINAAKRDASTTPVRPEVAVTELAEKLVESKDPEELAKYADHESSRIRECVAENHNTPASTFDKLSNDSNKAVREGVAENENTPASALDKLSNDSSRDVRKRVAENPNTPVHTLEKLSNDSDNRVREFVAKNPNTPMHILEKLF